VNTNKLWWDNFLNIARAKENVRTLADGVDPTSGEVLPVVKA
jgi:hypothetical protein